MAGTAHKLMTPEEFFVWQLGQEDRFELVEGVPVKMMAGASEMHDQIVINIIATLHTQLRGTRCRPATADLALRTRINSRRRGDVVVTCGEPPKPDVYEALEPKLVAEVLSPSNAGIGWQRKLEEYRRLQGLQYILLVESRFVGATLYTRDATGHWQTADYDALDGLLELPDIGCRLAMKDIYEGLTFAEAAPG